MKAPFGIASGKKLLAKRVVSLTPPHKVYVEAFAGAAHIFWRKPPSKKEVLNDLDPEIIAYYRFLKTASDEDFKDFLHCDWGADRKLFERLRDYKPGDKIERAWRFKYLNFYGFARERRLKPTFHVARAKQIPEVKLSLGQLKRWRERLKDVELLNEDALAVIRKFDSAETFFYLDPPYSATNIRYALDFPSERWQELLKVLRTLKGKFLLSSDSAVFKLGPDSHWQVRRVKTRYGIKDSASAVFEYLLSNYNLDRIQKTLAEGSFQLRRQTWRGPIVIRFGPSTEIFHLLLRLDGEELHYQLDNNPLYRKTVAAFEAEGLFDQLWRLGQTEQPQPGTKLNPTKETPSRIELLDRGQVELIDRTEGFFKFNFQGKKLKGLFSLAQETKDSPFWEFSVARGPKLKSLELEGRFVYQEHQLPGSRHWDLRIWPEGWAKGITINLFSDLREGGAPAMVKWCYDREVFGVAEPTTWRVDGLETKLFPLDAGKASLELVPFRLRLGGEKLHGSWRLVSREPFGLELQPEATYKRLEIPILKIDAEKRIVYGIVLEPDTPDAQGDVISAEEIEKAAHEFLHRSRVIGRQHKEVAKAYPVESWITPQDMEWNGQSIKKGTWLLGTKIEDEELWQLVKSGEINGYSIGGWGLRRSFLEDFHEDGQKDPSQNRP